jgi:hypothetical protein
MAPKDPLARTRGLLCEAVGEEAVIFDRDSKKAFRLNRTATIVWRHCDGKTSVEDLAGILQRELQLTEAAEPLVEMALQQVESMGLLEAPSGVTRRQAGKAIAAAAGLVPFVTAIALPTPARAASVEGPPVEHS